MPSSCPTPRGPPTPRGRSPRSSARSTSTAALKLTKGLSDAREFDRHHGNIAHELAGKDPAAAERVLGMVKEPYQHDQYIVRVVHRMAPVDLARAQARRRRRSTR